MLAIRLYADLQQVKEGRSEVAHGKAAIAASGVMNWDKTMHFKHLQRLQWQLSEHGIFCAKAFLQADAALNSGMTSGSGSFEWTTGLLQGELTHEVSWFSLMRRRANIRYDLSSHRASVRRAATRGRSAVLPQTNRLELHRLHRSSNRFGRCHEVGAVADRALIETVNQAGVIVDSNP
ncbi:hypothetical protein B7486_52025 [cyanobacterium TDX16]|nr:hypothetical protein B7486_52025 [cyanobacterium TDX16]